MDRPSVRVITYAWGRRYLDRLLDFALASLMAPGNLPALGEVFDCTFVVVTEEALFGHVEAHPLIQRVKSICPVRLIPLDDLIGEPWQYGMSLAYALFRGFADLGAAMTETYLLFLNADFILADGCYERLVPHMQRGEPVVLSPSYCAVEEAVAPVLEGLRAEQSGVLALSPRQLARMIIQHRHHTIRAKTINQSLLHFEYMDQAYWQVDDDTIVAHQMPISMVALRPERALADINTFWDWGITYEFCPSQRLTVIGDSDEFLMLELRSEATHRDLVRPGPTTPRAAAARMRVYITQYQIDNARFPLTLHAEALPPGVGAAQAKLREFFDKMLLQLPARAPGHRNHTQWIYHRWHLSRHIAARKLRMQIAALDEQSEKERIKAAKIRDGALMMLAASMAPRFAAIRNQLGDDGGCASAGPAVGQSRGAGDALAAIAAEFVREAEVVERYFQESADRSAAHHRDLAESLRPQLRVIEEGGALTLDDLGYCGVPDASLGTGEPARWRLVWSRKRAFETVRRIYAWMFGSVPHTRPWHPLHFICKEIAAVLDGTAARAGSQLLLVGEKNAIAARWTDPGGRQHLRVSAAGLLNGALDPSKISVRFGLCVVELDRETFARIRELRRALTSIVEPDGGVLMYWVNSACEPQESLQLAFAECALMLSDGATVRFFSSASGWGGLRMLRAGWESGRWRRWAARAAGLLDGFVKIGARYPIVGQSPQRNCWGAIIEIGVCNRSGVPLQAAPPTPAIQPPKSAEVGATL